LWRESFSDKNGTVKFITFQKKTADKQIYPTQKFVCAKLKRKT